MNFSICQSSDDCALTSKVLASLEQVRNLIKKINKNEKDCLFCSNDLIVHNLHGLMELYAQCIWCSQYHCTTLTTFPVEEIFLIETVLLSFVIVPKCTEISKIVNWDEKNEKIYQESLSDQLVAIFYSYYDAHKLKIDCEIEIESLFFVFYKKLNQEKQDKATDLCLIICYLRNEYSRFLSVLKSCKLSIFRLKLAILFSIYDEDEKLLTELTKKAFLCTKEKHNLTSFILNLQGHVRNINEILICFSESNIHEWTEKQKKEFYWKNCIKLWAENRSEKSPSVDNSMINICIQHEQFDDGWLIFMNSKFINSQSFNKAIVLCCTALKTVKQCKWFKRLVEVIDNIFLNIDIINFYETLEVLLSKIKSLSINILIKSINEIQTHILQIKMKRIYTELLMRYYSLYSYNSSSVELKKICCQHAIYIYTRWIRSKQSAFSILKKSNINDTKIFSYMLSICEMTKNCDFFSKVCKDVMIYGTRSCLETCKKHEEYHHKNCRDCDIKTKQIIAVNENDGFIYKMFK